MTPASLLRPHRLAILTCVLFACSFAFVHAQENDAKAPALAKASAPTETAAATALKAKGRIRLLGAEVPDRKSVV